MELFTQPDIKSLHKNNTPPTNYTASRSLVNVAVALWEQEKNALKHQDAWMKANTQEIQCKSGLLQVV